MTTSYIPIPSGFRQLPDIFLASGQCYSIAHQKYFEHNQSLIYQTMQGRQLVNQQFMKGNSGADPYFASSPSGQMVALLPPYEYQPGFLITGKVRAKKKIDTYIDDTHLFFLSTPRIPPNNQTTSSIRLINSGTTHYTGIAISSSDYAYYDFEIEPNPGEGNEFYVSVWADSPTSENSECHVTSLSIWEEDIID